MARVNAQQWLDKWSRRLSAAAPDIQSGVQRVTQAPGVSAAAAAPRMLAGVTAAVQSGVWANNVAKVSLPQWQSAMVNKAIPRLAQGITAAQQNKQQQITTFLSAVDAATADAQALPKGGLEQNIARSVAFQRSMSTRAPKRQK